MYPRRRLKSGTVEDLVDIICSEGVKWEMLPYDGALILYAGDDKDDEDSGDSSEEDEDEEEEEGVEDGEESPSKDGDESFQVWDKENEGGEGAEKGDGENNLLTKRIPKNKVVRRPYPGGVKAVRKRGINMDDILVVYDFKSQYPFSMITINLGKDSHLSTKQVYKCVDFLVRERGLSRPEAAKVLCRDHVNCCHTRRVDDLKSLVDNIDDYEYVRRNFVFFAKNVTAVQNRQFILEINSRVEDKIKSKDMSLPPDVRKNF